MTAIIRSLFLYMEDQDVQRFLTPLSTKTYWKPVLPLLITTKEQAENPIIFEDYANLSSDLLVEDLLALTDYVSERLGKEKVILIGHSYGTYIATQARIRLPKNMRLMLVLAR